VKAAVVMLVAASVSASAAHADPEVIATQPIAFATHGVEISYERPAALQYSWVAIAGVHLGAEGDYDASTFTVGGELRRWFRHDGAMRGPYVAAHLSVGRTTVSDAMGEIGASVGVTERIDFGWRWVIKHTVAITPSVGVGAIEDVDESHRLATLARPSVAIGLELGWYRR
jgi:hypothetical protein